MGIFRMYTGADGQSVIEELSQNDPVLETLKSTLGTEMGQNHAKGLLTYPVGPEEVHADRDDHRSPASDGGRGKGQIHC
jgi:hypothetical protein